MAGFVLAVDGGGTKTQVAVADTSGQLVLVAEGSGINPMDNPQWMAELNALLGKASSFLPELDFAVLGLPGFGEVPRFDSMLQQAVAQQMAAPHLLKNDVEAALDGAFLGEPGILLLAGTGSMLLASDGRGGSLRIGGWGETYGDEGSAYWIGREALGVASRALDGRISATDFAAALTGFLRVDSGSPNPGLMTWLHSLPHARSGVAALARFVDARAREGDAAARAILERAAQQLLDHLTAARRMIGSERPLPWSFAGGVFASGTVLDYLSARERPPIGPALPPIGGAVWRAATAAGWTINEPWISRLRTALTRAGRAAGVQYTDYPGVTGGGTMP
jgi:N-acetylglucosamine kinase-like BadF-type ATPase